MTRNNKRTIIDRLFSAFAIALALLVGAPAAHAAFINGVEQFSGTTLDLTTWEPYNPDVISQNNELIMDNQSLFIAEYVTRDVTIPAGGSVRAEVTLDDFFYNGGSVYAYAALLLIDNVTGDSDWHFNDNQFASVELYVATASGPGVSSDSHVSGQGFHQFEEPILGNTYVLELERLNASDVRFAAYQLDGTPIAEITRTIDLPEDAYIAIATNGTARFDNVIIPEPTSLALLGLGGLVMARRRRA